MSAKTNCLHNPKYILENSIRIRLEPKGAVIYTKHHSGYFVNKSGLKILNVLKKPKTIDEISNETNESINTVTEFIEKLQVLGLINVKKP